jgi:hypothetical protein
VRVGGHAQIAAALLTARRRAKRCQNGALSTFLQSLHGSFSGAAVVPLPGAADGGSISTCREPGQFSAAVDTVGLPLLP